MDAHAKQICKQFLLRQINEAQRTYDRLTACHCEYFGGKDCVCSQDENSVEIIDGKHIGMNGLDHERDSIAMRGIGPTKSCGINRNSESEHETISEDNEDASILRYRQANTKTKRIDPMSLWQHRMMTFSGRSLNIKPFIQQSSFDEHSYEGLRNPFVIIINNVLFRGNPVPRNGAEADLDNIKRFLRKANFTSCEIRENLDRNSMRRAFERTRGNPDLVNYDGLICFILSHGSDKGILAADNAHIKVDEITTMFGGDQCQSLATKPKLFFIQACRGVVDDKGFELIPRGANVVAPDTELDLSKVPVILPSDVDFLVAYSTTKGKCSYRQFMQDSKMMEKHSQSMGSWFISCLTQIIEKYSHEDLLTILTRVNKAMSELYTMESFKQVSCYHSVLTKKVYFPSIQSNNRPED